LEGRVRTQLDQQKSENQASVEKITGQLNRFEEAQKAADLKHNDSIKAIGNVYSVLGKLNLGHQRLNEQNPQQALYYARGALALINEQASHFGDDVALTNSLQGLRTSVLILRAESFVQMGDTVALLDAISPLTEKNCDCVEGNHYIGVGKLDLASDTTRDSSDRAEQRAEAIDALNKAIRAEKSQNFDEVLLAAAYFDKGSYGLASSSASDFAHSITESGQSLDQIGDRAKAQYNMGIAWQRLADFAKDESKTEITFPNECVAKQGTLGVIEGRIMERIFHAAKLSDSTVSERRRDAFKNYCEEGAEMAKHLTQIPCRVGPLTKVDDNNSDVVPAPDAVMEPGTVSTPAPTKSLIKKK
jgi:tetratricopeptide (TPR) repeat protein